MFSSTRVGEKTLREQGNDAFKEKEWEKAIELYTQALEADYNPARPDTEHLAALYSNRATAYIQRGEYSLAQVDINSVIRLKPGWYRAFERQAQLDMKVQYFDRAQRNYQLAEFAAVEAGCSKVAEQYRKSRDHVDRIAKAPRSKSSADFDFARTRDRFLAAGDNLDDRPAARIAIIAQDKIAKGWERLVDTDYDENPDEAYEALWDVVEGHFYEPSATLDRTRLASAPDIANSVLDCMRSVVPDCLTWDAFTIDKPELRAREIISHVCSIKPPHGFGGWVHFRDGHEWILDYLNVSIIGAIRTFHSSNPEPDLGYRWIEGAITIAERLQAEFLQLQENVVSRLLKGRVRRARSYALFLRMYELYGATRWDRDKVKELQVLAEKSFDAAVAYYADENPLDDPLEDIVHRQRPLARALFAQAWCMRVQAHWPENLRYSVRPLAWLNQSMLKAAADLARKASEYAPNDEEEQVIIKEFILRCEILAGGLTVGELFAKAAEVERTRLFIEKFWGLQERASPDPVSNRVACQIPLAAFDAIDDPRTQFNAQAQRYYSPPAQRHLLGLKLQAPTVIFGKLEEIANLDRAFEKREVQEFQRREESGSEPRLRMRDTAEFASFDV